MSMELFFLPTFPNMPGTDSEVHIIYAGTSHIPIRDVKIINISPRKDASQRKNYITHKQAQTS